MVKRYSLMAGLIVLLGILMFGSVEDASAKTEATGSGWEQGDNSGLSYGSGLIIQANQISRASGRGRGRGAAPREFVSEDLGEINETDAKALIYMREEEKLAHDVYHAMYELWGAPIFQNISSSEQRHTDAVKNLLDGYAVPDPAQETAGEFTNPELQALYNELVALGSQSLADALKVGAAIEEIDILDLQEILAETDNVAIQRVFSNLLRGSSNHLRAFTYTLTVQIGETYEPQYMSLEAYQAVLASSPQGWDPGGGRGRRRGGRP